ncbi:hypothetical protein [Mesorhizobium sp. B1-1-8]|uniref:hypothetical protein n=1 Tax=Mesorhizobium sp. B1-1-8 TaxID=2589976 RepID=UPI0011263857|nr:hypothetical protein [Mesorhizobium sp. B1-1-8]UCI09197.1 hypothetical protein FJ974_09095 [Mesorhizobium sp. B1-1-8]
MTEDVSPRSLAPLGVTAIAAGLLGIAVVQHNRAITASGGMDAHIHMMGADAGQGATARPTTTVKPLSCEKLPNVPGHSITTALVEFPPNAYTPRHRHPGSVTAFVIRERCARRQSGGDLYAGPDLVRSAGRDPRLR